MNKNKKNRKGFTIVELVIVIAVIGILATVLVPTFGDVIADAKNAKLVQEIKNEHTNYAMKYAAADNFSENVVIKLGTKYYSFTNGTLTVDANGVPVEATAPASGAYYFDAADDTYKPAA